METAETTENEQTAIQQKMLTDTLRNIKRNIYFLPFLSFLVWSFGLHWLLFVTGVSGCSTLSFF